MLKEELYKTSDRTLKITGKCLTRFLPIGTAHHLCQGYR